jgi:NAD+ synthase (glutamine-hydrolysing)
VPIGTDLLFVSVDDPTIVIGVETCEDVWTALPPSSFAAVAGANVLVNLSASNELVGKDEYRRNLITQQSGRCIAAYIYSSAGDGESTTDVVFGGHCMIAENGTLLAESKRFQEMGHSIFVDLDIENCIHERMRTTSFGKCAAELKHREPYRRIFVSNLVTHTPKIEEFQTLLRPNTSHPFVPAKDADRDGVCKEVFDIVVAGLAHRLKKTRSKTVVLGLSGGLDSTLALLTCCKAFDRLGYDHANIRAFTMPGFGTSKRTRLNAMRLAAATFITLEEISVEEGSKVVLENIGHDGTTEDVTFENAQARYRTLILMQKANQLKGIVVGTGDLSESALGWCTYNGDQMSHYNVNCGIPKTLVRFVVDWVSKLGPDDLEKVLQNILTTPVSPELKKLQAGKITQKTEDHIGPYDLHDFFLYHLQRRGAAPRKILYLAVHAFKGAFTKEEIKKWLVLFITRFFQNQFKRSAMPDGPKVGSVSLSQRGDWRMPSDATAKQWLADLEDE